MLLLTLLLRIIAGLLLALMMLITDRLFNPLMFLQPMFIWNIVLIEVLLLLKF